MGLGGPTTRGVVRPTYHLVPAAVWAEVDRTAPYRAASLSDEGFVHCTDGVDELIATANRHYRDDRRPFVALAIDLDRAGSPWTVEDERRIYPHVHGPIAADSIVDVQSIEREADGTFRGLVAVDQEPGSGG